MHQFGAINLQAYAYFVLLSACGHLHLRHGAYAGQRLATKTHRAQREEVFYPADLAGGMPLKGHAGIGLTHALAVVNHLEQGASGIAYDDLNISSPGIQAVLHQLLQTRSRPLDHFSGGYLVGYMIG